MKIKERTGKRYDTSMFKRSSGNLAFSVNNYKQIKILKTDKFDLIFEEMVYLETKIRMSYIQRQ